MYFRHNQGEDDPLELGIIGSLAVDGTYKVVVSKSGCPLCSLYNPSWTGSQASVQLYNGAAPLAAQLGGGLKRVPSTCGTNTYWYAGDLTKSGTSYTWTNKNLCTTTEP